MANYTISKIQLPNGDICNIKDTTYESKAALNGSTDVSLVTRGEKYIWNNKANVASTLSGYGITDAKIASGVITLGSNTITPLTASSTLDATKLSGTASINTTGNATTATKFNSNRSIALTGDVTGSASSQAGWSIATILANSGVTANTYGNTSQ